jgi:ABC-type sugar transport system substrate-binding protein
MRHKLVSFGLSLLMAVAALFGATAPAHAQAKKPNIVVIMGDDVGAWDTRR